MKSLLSATQHIGRSLMLPIAVLPVAGLLLRLGQPDLLNLAPMAAAGGAVFSNLGLLFAIGVAVGLARENHGAAGLAAVVGYLVATKGAEVLIQVPPEAIAGLTGHAAELASAAYKTQGLSKLSVPMGILSGILGGVLYNRYANLQLPSFLSFFGGRRFVPIVTGCAGVIMAFVFGYGWSYLNQGMDELSQFVLTSGPIGLFLYGVLNRFLLVTGLHHILNNVAWFIVGDFHGATGDLNRFMAGDPTAGEFMSGFFPVMMFGLPAACLAMYRSATPARRRAAGGLLLSMALTSFLTGVTEPIEFSFMFLAPALYVLHAVLTGTAMVVMNLLGSHLGFSFSAGLFDYVLNYGRATNPLLLLPVGAAYFIVYYGLFRFFIVRFNLETPGRERAVAAEAPLDTLQAGLRGDQFVAALGGPANFRSVDACTTRLRLELVTRSTVDFNELKRLGARGVVKPGVSGLQVVVGPIADIVASEIRASLGALHEAGGKPARIGGGDKRSAEKSGAERLPSGEQVIASLGGSDNIEQLEAVPGRVLIRVADAHLVDEEALRGLGVRGVAIVEPDRVHLLHANAEGLMGELDAALD